MAKINMAFVRVVPGKRYPIRRPKFCKDAVIKDKTK
jgi:hypothetical protein